ncbi:hypothetical protein CLV30_109112 [Haloactinopolyspora alba]|uniref:Uncharacterized protein n=1 Tax=Haloactinopolyspora alba TaxID=648780 RepID=A0A2P8E011_9ACTN|nr:hypothetical protein [Haloactinopolyspora alba]PSL02804.1 hypothetical protein CLV30_109112 [Haloactinopolyspora alba]
MPRRWQRTKRVHRSRRRRLVLASGLAAGATAAIVGRQKRSRRTAPDDSELSET